MRGTQPIIAAAVLVAAAAAVSVAVSRDRAPDAPDPPAPDEAPAPAPAPRTTAGAPARRVQRSDGGPSLPAAPEPSAPLPAGALAVVNGVAITPAELVSDGTPPDALAPDEYAARMDRAIDAELTFQAARARGVTLSPEQEVVLGKLRASYTAEVEKAKGAGQSWSSVTPAQVDLDARLTTALLLQQALVKASGGPPPDDPRYAAARRALLEDLRAQASIAR